MLDEASLLAALAQVGYRRVGHQVYHAERSTGIEHFIYYVYRAEWSTEIEHFIYVQLYGTPKEFLAAEFGLRNRESQSFALRSLQTYGDLGHRLIRYDARTDCFMRFSLGQLAGSWGMPASLTISAMPGPVLARRIRDDVAKCLLPLVRDVTSPDRFLSVLLTDAEPFSWSRSSGAMRAAMVAFVAHRLGMPSREIRARLEPHFKGIAYSLLGAPDRDPGSFVDKVIRDASSGVSTDSPKGATRRR